MSSPPCAAGMWPLHTPSAVQGWNPFDSIWWDEFMGAPVDTMMETVKDSVSSFKKRYAALKPPLEKELSLTILHINDHHSHIEGESFSLETDSAGEVSIPYGGYPRLVPTFNRLESGPLVMGRRMGEERRLQGVHRRLMSGEDVAQSSNVLKLHAGDAITGTSYYSVFKGEADVAVMKHVCFDAYEMGNHEFDDGDTNLAAHLDRIAGMGCGTVSLGANIAPGPDSPLVGKRRPRAAGLNARRAAPSRLCLYRQAEAVHSQDVRGHERRHRRNRRAAEDDGVLLARPRHRPARPDRDGAKVH